MKKLTKPQAVKLLEKLVADKGADYVYQTIDSTDLDSCVYVDPNTMEASCGVGIILSEWGVPIDALKSLDEQRNSQIGSVDLEVLEEAGFDIREAIPVLQAFQSAQDTLNTYSVALEKAKKAC